MNSDRILSVFAGILYFTIFIAGVFSIAPAADNPDYLREAALNAGQIRFNAFSQFIMVFAYAGIGILLYQIVKRAGERLALGFLCSRVIAAVFVVAGVILLLLILKVSFDYTTSGTPSPDHFMALGDLLRSCRDLVNHVAMVISVSVGGLMLYSATLKARMIPVWLSLWGLAGASLAILASLLVMSGQIEIITPVYLILNVPMGMQELVFGGWLMFRGITTSQTQLN